jgi:hypothetical protein
VTKSLSKEEANIALRRAFADPVAVYEGWIERYGYPNPIDELRQDIGRKLVDMKLHIGELIANISAQKSSLRGTEEQVRRMLSDAYSGKAELHSLLRQIKETRLSQSKLLSSPIELDFVGQFANAPLISAEIAKIISCALNALGAGTLKYEDSVGLDIMHSCYLPISDLWRSDKRFARTLQTLGTPFAEKIVPLLVDLPGCIEKLREQQALRAS